MTIHPIVRQIINRDCHVGQSNRQVIRHVVTRLAHGYQTFAQMPREDRAGKMGRRTMMRQCIAQHAENRKIYGQVMRGTARPSQIECYLSTGKVRRTR